MELIRAEHLLRRAAKGGADAFAEIDAVRAETPGRGLLPARHASGEGREQPAERLRDGTDRTEVRAGPHDHLCSAGAEPPDRRGEFPLRPVPWDEVDDVIASDEDHGHIRPVARLDPIDLRPQVP